MSCPAPITALCSLALLLGLAGPCSGATSSSPAVPAPTSAAPARITGDQSVIVAAANLPPEIALDRATGRGGGLIVNLRLEDGQEIPVGLDTGSGGNFLDKSLEPKLGQRLGQSEVTLFEAPRQSAGIYATPKLYLGGVPLMTGPRLKTYDFKRMKIKGLIGMDCLRHYCLQLDFAAGKMRFLDSARLDTNDLGQVYALTYPASGRVFLHHASFTGGASTNLTLEADYLHGRRWPSRELPPTYALVDTGFTGFDGRVAGAKHLTLHLAKSVWDGRPYMNLTIRQGGDNANIIGLKFLARHLVTFDFPAHRLYLKQTSVGHLTN